MYIDFKFLGLGTMRTWLLISSQLKYFCDSMFECPKPRASWLPHPSVSRPQEFPSQPEPTEALSVMHSPAGLGLQAAWSSSHATALSLGHRFSNFLDFKSHLEQLITNADFWILQIIWNQILQEDVGIYIINKCQGHHYGPGSILGKPRSRNNTA